MAALVELVIEMFGWFIPDRDSKYARIQAVTFLLGVGAILAAILFFFGDYFEFGSP